MYRLHFFLSRQEARMFWREIFCHGAVKSGTLWSNEEMFAHSPFLMRTKISPSRKFMVKGNPHGQCRAQKWYTIRLCLYWMAYVCTQVTTWIQQTAWHCKFGFQFTFFPSSSQSFPMVQWSSLVANKHHLVVGIPRNICPSLHFTWKRFCDTFFSLITGRNLPSGERGSRWNLRGFWVLGARVSRLFCSHPMPGGLCKPSSLSPRPQSRRSRGTCRHRRTLPREKHRSCTSAIHGKLGALKRNVNNYK